MIVKEDFDFLYWLKQRLVYLHHYHHNDTVVQKIDLLINKLSDTTIDLVTTDIDKIISKYFIDFGLTKDHTLNIGYSEKERNELRNAIISIALDIYNGNIPEETLIK